MWIWPDSWMHRRLRRMLAAGELVRTIVGLNVCYSKQKSCETKRKWTKTRNPWKRNHELSSILMLESILLKISSNDIIHLIAWFSARAKCARLRVRFLCFFLPYVKIWPGRSKALQNKCKKQPGSWTNCYFNLLSFYIYFAKLSI